MSRGLVRQSDNTDSASQSSAWGTGRSVLLYLMICTIWWSIFHFARFSNARGNFFLILILTLICVHAALVYLFDRSLLNKKLNKSKRYQFAYLASALLGVGFLVIEAFTLPAFDIIRSFFLIAAVLVGSFSGALGLTWQRDGLAENNSPPDDTILKNVRQQHQKLIGEGDPLDLRKRALDISVATIGILLSSPFWLLSVLLIWLENPGPILFVKNSVTRGGKNFRQYKFRTMVRDAEDGTGPILAKEQDERVLHFGGLLRKTALDELPQLLNILRGEMSFVGPRPQRTVLVAGYLQAMPEYAERHRILPGLAGLAQVAGDYYLTPRQKLRFDRLYIHHASLGFDLKLLGLAILITFWYRWQPGWNGRLPRRFLHHPLRRP